MKCDVAIIGGGIAGISAAAMISQTRSVIVLEREDQPGYHATGRSAALFSEIYGNAPVRALSVASRAFLEHPPEGFANAAILTDRGAMHVGSSADTGLLDGLFATSRQLVSTVQRYDAPQTLAMVPALRTDQVGGSVYEPDARDIDTNELLQGFIRQLRSNGGQILTRADVTAMSGGRDGWRLETRAGQVDAEIVINAAGAWADPVAIMAGASPLGLQPKRRSVFVFKPASDFVFDRWPLVVGIHEDYYFKPDAGMLLVSPADETPSEPMDAWPDDMDIAIAADRLMSVTSLDVQRVEHQWAGLRTFAPDKTPVVGFDPKVPGFMWLAGQGGYGFQTAPAMARLACALSAGQPVPSELLDLGITQDIIGPSRFSE